MRLSAVVLTALLAVAVAVAATPPAHAEERDLIAAVYSTFDKRRGLDGGAEVEIIGERAWVGEGGRRQQLLLLQHDGRNADKACRVDLALLDVVAGAKPKLAALTKTLRACPVEGRSEEVRFAKRTFPLATAVAAFGIEETSEPAPDESLASLRLYVRRGASFQRVLDVRTRRDTASAGARCRARAMVSVVGRPAAVQVRRTAVVGRERRAVTERWIWDEVRQALQRVESAKPAPATSRPPLPCE